MNIPTETTYMTSFPKRNDITGALDQVFKFDNFLDCLTGGIRANTIAAIGTINPGSLCLQYLFAPQIHYNLSGEPIAFIGNSSNKKGEFYCSPTYGMRIHKACCSGLAYPITRNSITLLLEPQVDTRSYGTLLAPSRMT